MKIEYFKEKFSRQYDEKFSESNDYAMCYLCSLPWAPVANPAQLAKKLGVGRNLVSKWLHGEKKELLPDEDEKLLEEGIIPDAYIWEICKLFNIELELFCEESIDVFKDKIKKLISDYDYRNEWQHDIENNAINSSPILEELSQPFTIRIERANEVDAKFGGLNTNTESAVEIETFHIEEKISIQIILGPTWRKILEEENLLYFTMFHIADQKVQCVVPRKNPIVPDWEITSNVFNIPVLPENNSIARHYLTMEKPLGPQRIIACLLRKKPFDDDFRKELDESSDAVPPDLLRRFARYLPKRKKGAKKENYDLVIMEKRFLVSGP